MTVMEAIHEIDSLKPNTYPQQQKIQWLDRLDSFIEKSLLSRFPQEKRQPLSLGDPSRVLLMESPFDEGYLFWLEAKIHYFHEELDRYNGAVRMFRGVLEDWQRQLLRDAEPVNPGTCPM